MNVETRNAAPYPPYIHDWRTSANTVWISSLTLVPILVWSSSLYGSAALWVWVISLLSATGSEAIVSGIRRNWTLGDGSAVLTGLLVATAMPPGCPWYIPALSSAFAIFIVKAAFGGLGANWMNPALAGIAFAYANWPATMREYILPRLVSGVDGVSAVTPMSFAKGLSGGVQGRVMDALRGANYPLSKMDVSVTTFMNDTIFSRIGARLPDGYIDLLVGFKPGTLGESALIAIFLGSMVLVSLRIVRAAVPLTMLGVFALLVRIFGTGLPGEDIFAGDVLFALSSGGVVIAAFYMASDPVTSPVGRGAGIVYAAAIGVLTFIFRRWGAFTESVAYAVLLMNVLTPFMEKTVAKVSAIPKRVVKP